MNDNLPAPVAGLVKRATGSTAGQFSPGQRPYKMPNQPSSRTRRRSGPVEERATINVGNRCAWAEHDPLLRAYHDEEWGVPEFDSRALWEKLMLDGFQAGLSWITVLRKRDAFREAFRDFDPKRSRASAGPMSLD